MKISSLHHLVFLALFFHPASVLIGQDAPDKTSLLLKIEVKNFSSYKNYSIGLCFFNNTSDTIALDWDDLAAFNKDVSMPILDVFFLDRKAKITTVVKENINVLTPNKFRETYRIPPNENLKKEIHISQLFGIETPYHNAVYLKYSIYKGDALKSFSGTIFSNVVKFPKDITCADNIVHSFVDSLLFSKKKQISINLNLLNIAECAFESEDNFMINSISKLSTMGHFREFFLKPEKRTYPSANKNEIIACINKNDVSLLDFDIFVTLYAKKSNSPNMVIDKKNYLFCYGKYQKENSLIFKEIAGEGVVVIGFDSKKNIKVFSEILECNAECVRNKALNIPQQ